MPSNWIRVWRTSPEILGLLTQHYQKSGEPIRLLILADHMTRMAAVFVPRLGFSVSAPFVTQAINKSIEELGFQAATPDQVNVVMKFVSGRDVFVSLPTGSGKSVCFASVSIVFDKLKQNRLKHSTPSSVTIVISPLNALMVIRCRNSLLED